VLSAQVTKGRNPVTSGLAIRAFRDMGFRTSSAICEIVDNSLEAEATKIQIFIDFKKKELLHTHRRIEKFVFIDNGYGMNKDLLFDCLVLGEGTKRALKKGIGKFGVGATFAGISQGEFIGVYSKTKGGKILYTQLDLALLDQGEGIPEPFEKDPPEQYRNELSEQGTIVIWEKIDTVTNEKDLDDIKHNVGRIYRKFLTEKTIENGKLVDNNPITLTINTEPVAPYDPLYVTFSPKSDDKELAKFTSEEYPLKFGNIKSKMRITISYLPESWWDNPDWYKPGQEPVNKIERKITNKNNGISIIREGREMAFGEIAFLKLYILGKEDAGSPFVDEDRWTGVEVEFQRDADKIFGIEANKSKIFLPRYIREQIGTILRSILIERRNYFSKIRGEKLKKTGKNKPDRPDKSKKIIQNYMPSPHYSDTEKKNVREFAEKIGSGKQEIEEFYNDLVKGYLPINSWDLDPSGPFVQYEHHLKSIIVKYNMNHPFMKKFFETLSDIAERKGEDPNNALSIEEIQRTKTLFDLLLASYGLSEISFPDPSHQEEIQNTLNTLKSNWGDIAHRISKRDIKTQ